MADVDLALWVACRAIQHTILSLEVMSSSAEGVPYGFFFRLAGFGLIHSRILSYCAFPA